MNLLYFAGACLVLAQILGVYALMTRKADLIFSVIMVSLLAVAVIVGGVAVYHRIH